MDLDTSPPPAEMKLSNLEDEPAVDNIVAAWCLEGDASVLLPQLRRRLFALTGAANENFDVAASPPPPSSGAQVERSEATIAKRLATAVVRKIRADAVSGANAGGALLGPLMCTPQSLASPIILASTLMVTPAIDDADGAFRMPSSVQMEPPPATSHHRNRRQQQPLAPGESDWLETSGLVDLLPPPPSSASSEAHRSFDVDASSMMDCAPTMPPSAAASPTQCFLGGSGASDTKLRKELTRALTDVCQALLGTSRQLVNTIKASAAQVHKLEAELMTAKATAARLEVEMVHLTQSDYHPQRRVPSSAWQTSTGHALTIRQQPRESLLVNACHQPPTPPPPKKPTIDDASRASQTARGTAALGASVVGEQQCPAFPVFGRVSPTFGPTSLAATPSGASGCQWMGSDSNTKGNERLQTATVRSTANLSRALSLSNFRFGIQRQATGMSPPIISSATLNAEDLALVSPMARSLHATSLRAVRMQQRAQESIDDIGMPMLNQYVILSELGAGCQGTVNLALDTETEELRAIKVIARPVPASGVGLRKQRENQLMLAQLQREIAIMKRCRHTNVVALYEVIDDPDADSMYLVMQFVEKGSVAKQTANGETTPIDGATLASYAKQLCSGLQYLHSRGIVHRDIKPENLLLGANGVVYLSDFGISSIDDSPTSRAVILPRGDFTPTFAVASFQRSPPAVARDRGESSVGSTSSIGLLTAAEWESVPHRGGSRAYLAPELLIGVAAATRTTTTTTHPRATSPSGDRPRLADGCAADVWALGMSLYVMLYGQLPWRETNAATFMDRVTSADAAIPFPATTREGQCITKLEQWTSLLNKMLCRDLKLRISATEAFEAAMALVQEYNATEIAVGDDDVQHALTAVRHSVN